MRTTELAYKAADRLARGGGLEVELTGLGHLLVVAGFALSISGRFSAVHRGRNPRRSTSTTCRRFTRISAGIDDRCPSPKPSRIGTRCEMQCSSRFWNQVKGSGGAAQRVAFNCPGPGARTSGPSSQRQGHSVLSDICVLFAAAAHCRSVAVLLFCQCGSERVDVKLWNVRAQLHCLTRVHEAWLDGFTAVSEFEPAKLPTPAVIDQARKHRRRPPEEVGRIEEHRKQQSRWGRQLFHPC